MFFLICVLNLYKRGIESNIILKKMFKEINDEKVGTIILPHKKILDSIFAVFQLRGPTLKIIRCLIFYSKIIRRHLLFHSINFFVCPMHFRF